MRDEVDAVLRGCGDVAARRRLVAAVGRGAFDAEVRSGALVAPFPRAYCRPWSVDDPNVLERAALTSVGPPAALSHATALRRHDLLARPSAVHVTVPASRSLRQNGGLVVHRTHRFPPLQRIDGLPTVTAAAALTDCWPLLPPSERRAPVIDAVRRGIATVAELRSEVQRRPRLADRRALLELLELLAAGCESELEIWGLLHVFDAPGLRHGHRQYWVSAGGRNYRLDLAYLAERVAVEMDGAGTHGSRSARERDIARDAALAAIGWLTLRFSYERLTQDVSGCRRETLAVLAHRL